MIWLTWRQFRPHMLITAMLLAAALIYLLISGLAMHHTYSTDVASCARTGGCSDTLSALQQSYHTAFILLQSLVVVTPALIGIFWGAPLISRELETGTNQLVWNQSITRVRWLAVKLAIIGTASIATAAMLGYMLTWWAGPLDHINGTRFAALTFASRDLVPFAYSSFAFAFGAAAGLLLRRTVPAMAVTLAVVVGLQVLMPTVIRPHLASATTVAYPINSSAERNLAGVYTTGGGAEVHFVLPAPPGAWVISAPPVENASNQVVPADRYDSCLFPNRPGAANKAGAPSAGQTAACLARDDLHESISYQPANHYWPLQWAETGLFLALAALSSATCFLAIRIRRT